MRSKFSIFLIIIICGLALVFAYLYVPQLFARNTPNSESTQKETTIAKDNEITNIALLGIGGDGHEGGELTDSIMIASLNHSTHKVTLVSIPRDIWIQQLVAKVNSIYYYGEQQNKGTGLTKTQEALNLITNLKIHYSIILDFSGFIKAIDAVGGIKVNVDNTFDDYKYPIPGKERVEPESDRYEHVHFEHGDQLMDGVTALKYARSRHALGVEGTDFARSARQQKIIRAFVSSLVSTQTVFNPERLTLLSQSIKSSLNSNIQDSLIPDFIKLGISLDFDQIKTISIEQELQNPKNLAPYNGSWVLIPKNNWETVHAYIQANLDN